MFIINVNQGEPYSEPHHLESIAKSTLLLDVPCNIADKQLCKPIISSVVICEYAIQVLYKTQVILNTTYIQIYKVNDQAYSYIAVVYVTVCATTDMFACKLKFILLPQLIAIQNNYACSLLSLANVNWSAFQSAFCRPCKSMTGEMAPKEGSNLAVRPDLAPTVSAHLSRLFSGQLAFCGYMHTQLL